MPQKYESPGSPHDKNRVLKQLEGLPSFEELGLGYEQQQALARYATLGHGVKLDTITIAELANTLATQEIYRAGFEWVLKQRDWTREGVEQSHPITLINLSQVAIHVVVGSYDVMDVTGEKRAVDTTVVGQLACWAILSHEQLANLPLDSFTKLVGDTQRAIGEPRHEHADESLDTYRSLPFSYRSMLDFKRVLHFLKKIPLNQNKESRLAGRLSDENSELFSRTRELQKYGVKSVYVAKADALPIVDWHIFDMQSVGIADFSVAGDTYRCTFAGFSRPLINEPPEFSPGIMTHKLEGPNAVGFQLDLHDDGHLYTRGIIVPLARFADRLGMMPQYELLRARALSIYADSVMPAYIIDQSDQIRAVNKQISQARRARTKDFLELVLARQRVLASPDMPRLIDQNERDEKRRRRVVSPHGVVGFIRRLPAGQRASQAQRQLCLEDQGIELPPIGETYVRAHTRGGNRQGEAEAKAHRGRIRRVGGAIISQVEDDSQNPSVGKPPEPKPRLALPGR